MVRKYRLDRIVDCLRIFSSMVFPRVNDSLNPQAAAFLDSLNTLGKVNVDEETLLYLSRICNCFNRASMVEIMLASETRAKYKFLNKSDSLVFVKEQHRLGFLKECRVCGEHRVKNTKDHIFPKSKGGVDHIFNIEEMCLICNQNKSDSVDNKPFIEVYYHKDCKILLPVYQANKLGLTLNKNSLKGIVYADNPHILQLPNLV
jgi:5-methylcytosine-specific restriction endonuclease McrA